MKRFRKIWAIVPAGLIAFGLGAAGAHAQDQVNVRFSWKLKGEYAPLYLAQEKGYYAKDHLKVRMGEGAGAQAALGALIQGHEDIVVLPGIFALSAIQKGIPVKLIALYQPKTPIALISFPDKPVRRPKDLEGKTVATSVGETATTYLGVFCKLNHVDCNQIHLVTMNNQARYPSFIERHVDVVSVYEDTDLPIIEAKEKKKFVVMNMVKYGLAIPGLALATSDQDIAHKADALKRYLRATNAGLADAKAHPEEATQALLKNWPGAPDSKIVAEQVRIALKTYTSVPGHPAGWIDQKTIADALHLLQSTGQISAAKPADAFYTDALLSK